MCPEWVCLEYVGVSQVGVSDVDTLLVNESGHTNVGSVQYLSSSTSQVVCVSDCFVTCTGGANH